MKIINQSKSGKWQLVEYPGAVANWAIKYAVSNPYHGHMASGSKEYCKRVWKKKFAND